MKQILAVLLTDTHLKEDNLQIVKSIVKQTLDYCKDNGVKKVYHLGDIFNSRKALSLSVLVEGMYEILEMFQDYDIDLMLIPGNHDKTSYFNKESFIHPFQTHPRLQYYPENTHMGLSEDINLTLLPFFADQEYLQFLKKAETQLDSKKVNIMFTHIGIDGARMNNGSIVEGIHQRDFDSWDKIFIGHYHDKQVLGKDDKFNYIGASLQHNYGETQDKGLTILYNDLSWETLELDFPRYIKLEVDAKKLTISDINEVVKISKSSKDNLKVVLVGNEADVKSVQKQTLLDAGLKVEMKVDSIKIEEVQERVEPFNSQSLVEQFEVFCEKNNLDVTKGMKYLNQIL